MAGTVLGWERRIAASPEAVWERLADFARMHEWFLGVRRVTLAAAPAEGVQRTLQLFTGRSHLERLAGWDPPRSFCVQVLHPPFFARDFRGRIRLLPSSGATLLRWELRYAPRFGLAGRLADRVLVRPVLHVAFRASLRRLAILVERDG